MRSRKKPQKVFYPPRHLAPFVREMEKLPESHLVEIKKEIAESPDNRYSQTND